MLRKDKKGQKTFGVGDKKLSLCVGKMCKLKGIKTHIQRGVGFSTVTGIFKKTILDIEMAYYLL